MGSRGSPLPRHPALHRTRRQSPAGGTDQCIKTSVVYLSPHKLPEKGAGTGPPFVAGVPTADDPTLSGKWPAVARDVPAWRAPGRR